MADWTERWLTRPLAPDARTCSAFVEEVLAAQFGREVRLPAAQPGVRSRDRQVQDWLRDGLGCRTETPVSGDGVLMECLGARELHGWHVGLHVQRGKVLHWMAGTGAVLHAVADLPLVGLRLEGFYRWT